MQFPLALFVSVATALRPVALQSQSRIGAVSVHRVVPRDGFAPELANLLMGQRTPTRV